jgi:predicted dehydrogenase
MTFHFQTGESMTKKIKAAVIGLGVGMAHAKGYKANPDAELYAVCDADPTRLNERGDQLGIPPELRFCDYQELLRLPELDVVSIGLPNFMHAPVALAAFNAGKHVLCEKPLACSADDAAAMVREAKACGRQLMVCFNYRFRDDARWLLSMRDAGRLGSIYFARAGWQRNSGIPGFGGWFTTRAMSGGGPLIDLGVHILDLTLWLMGYPRPVAVSGQTFAQFGPRGLKASSKKHVGSSFDVEDMTAGFVRFENNAALQIETSWASHTKPGRDDYFVNLYGSEGGAELYVANYTDRDTLTFYTEECGQPVAIKPNIINRAAGHELAVAHFVDCVSSGRPVESTGEQGLALMQIIEGIYESSQTGKEVRLD